MTAANNDLELYIESYKQAATGYYETANRVVSGLEKGSPQAHKAVTELGSRMGALSKSTKRRLICDKLISANHERGMDITPTVARNASKRLLGRGLDELYLNKAFGTPGRTAENKSTVTAADLEQLEASIRRDLDCMVEKMADFRRKLKQVFQMKPNSA
jgi:hypothetical protein